MNDFGQAVLDRLQSASIGGGIAIAVALLATLLLRRLPPAVLSWVWRLALLKVIVGFLWLSPLEIRVLGAVAPAPPGPATYAAEATGAGSIEPNTRAVARQTGADEHASASFYLGGLWLLGVLGLGIVRGRSWRRANRFVLRLRASLPRIVNKISAAQLVIGLLFTPTLLLAQTRNQNATVKAPIDRRALVTRHNVVLTAFDGDRPLQVGNGEFAFGMDATGLQTFAPFNTMSHWGWHSGPLPSGQKIEDFRGQVWDTHGRPVRYPMPDPQHPELSSWMTSNPHRINLGRIGLRLSKVDGSAVLPSDLKNVRQTLDLWSGVITSRFELGGLPVTVKTACHPKMDTVAVQVSSPLVGSGRIGAFFAAPGDDPRYLADYVGDWSHPARLTIEPSPGQRADLVRRLDASTYRMALRWDGNARLSEQDTPPQRDLMIVGAEYGAGKGWADVTDVVSKAVSNGRLSLRVDSRLAPDPSPGLGKRLRVTYSVGGTVQTVGANENEELTVDAASVTNRVFLTPSPGSETLSFSCTFSSGAPSKGLPSPQDAFEASRRHWPLFWKSGGAIDLSESKDPRWKELERRVVLSQYLMAVNEAGSNPPQESGLVNNGWYGRFHTEMVWWHGAHWALWNRWPELNRFLGIYAKLLPRAKEIAKSQGYPGARWPKAIGPDGREWPHEIHALLAWQQPHPIFFAELDYRAHPTPATLKKWQPITDATADFMASYAFFEEGTKRYVLGPPIHLASENTDPKTTKNPAFELGYWRFGLRMALEWRKRMGLPPKPEWEKVLSGLSPLPTQDGVYVLHEGVQDMWTKFNFEHPALTGAYGMLPGDGVDPATMRRTLDKVRATWNFERVWGWDFPMLAMCAARLGEPDRTIDFLLTSSSNFQFDERGLATGGPFPYFPSNGGLLYAVAMMARGWDGAPRRNAPGFPNDGRWSVRWEGLSPAP